MIVAAPAGCASPRAASSASAAAAPLRRPRRAGRPAAVKRWGGMPVGLEFGRATSAYRPEARSIEARRCLAFRDKSPPGSAGVAQPRGDAIDGQVDAALDPLGGGVVLATHAVAP